MTRTHPDRRSLLLRTATLGGSLLLAPAFVHGLVARRGHARAAGLGEGGYGPLFPKPDAEDGVVRLALPDGFSYQAFGIQGTTMSDGNATPLGHDGMCAFELPNGNVRLIRNHEDRVDAGVTTLKGDPQAAYDPVAGGSTTSLELSASVTGKHELVRDFVSLNGTIVNCAGGPTPWGTWLSCEESTEGTSDGWSQPHGYVYEVDVLAEDEVPAPPLRDMGRFYHEAVAVDPVSGVVYQTEDRNQAGFYRFVPHRPGKLALGGTLQMLAVQGQPGYDTRSGQVEGAALRAEWVDVPDPDPPGAEVNSSEVFEQGLAAGGAIFERLEGCWNGPNSVFFVSTSGGDVSRGQVWEYGPFGKRSGGLRLVFESPSAAVLSRPDNLTVSPRGGLLLCEDATGPVSFLRGLTSKGGVFDFAENLMNDREWAGATFSPDGETLFVNIQGSTSNPSSSDLGHTFAIWGPWRKGEL